MRLGPYEVVRHLGAGGMSTVWLARGPLPSGETGLVVLKRQIRSEDDDGLREEARVGLRLRHPGVVQTLGTFDDDDGRPLLVLEYVAGVSLAQLRRRGPLPAPAVSRIGADIAEALFALHDARDQHGGALRILHRDVTPANIIVSHEGDARLIDLGIARSNESRVERTATGAVRGTLRYVAPELFDGKEHAPSTDLWALGVCLFEAALGRPAASGSEAVILAAVLRGQLLQLQPSERIDAQLHEVIDRLCARDVGARFPDARAAAHHLAAGDVGDGAMLASIAVYAAADQPRNDTAPQARSPGPSSAGPAVGPARGALAGPTGPAGGDEDGFARMAAGTYCGEDDAFSEVSQASTLVTPSAWQDQLVPAPVTALVDPNLAAAAPGTDTAATLPHGVHAGLAAPRPPAPASFDHLDVPATTPGTPGGMRRGPAPGDSWDVPQPITGEDTAASSSPAAPRASSPAPLLAPNTAPTLDELPIDLPLVVGSAEATRGAFGATVRPSVDEPSRSADLVDLREHAIGAPSVLAVVVVVVALALVLLVALSR